MGWSQIGRASSSLAVVLLLGGAPAAHGDEPPANPLAPAPAEKAPPAPAEPAWAGAWADEEVTLTLERTGFDTFRGKLTAGEQAHAVSGSAKGQRLSGSFRIGETTFVFTATLEGPELELTSDGARRRLARPGALRGVHRGPARRINHKDGFSFELPSGLSLVKEKRDGGGAYLVFSTKKDGRADALVMLFAGPVPASDRGTSPLKQLTDLGPDICEKVAMADGSPGATPRELTLDAGEGAEATWTGTFEGEPALVWAGQVRVDDRFVMVLAVLPAGKADERLPRAKRMLESARFDAGR